MSQQEFSIEQLDRVGPNRWHIDLGTLGDGLVIVQGAPASAEFVADQLNGRQRAIFGKALEGRMMAIGGLLLVA